MNLLFVSNKISIKTTINNFKLKLAPNTLVDALKKATRQDG